MVNGGYYRLLSRLDAEGDEEEEMGLFKLTRVCIKAENPIMQRSQAMVLGLVARPTTRRYISSPFSRGIPSRRLSSLRLEEHPPSATRRLNLIKNFTSRLAQPTYQHQG